MRQTGGRERTGRQPPSVARSACPRPRTDRRPPIAPRTDCTEHQRQGPNGRLTAPRIPLSRPLRRPASLPPPLTNRSGNQSRPVPTARPTAPRHRPHGITQPRPCITHGTESRNTEAAALPPPVKRLARSTGQAVNWGRAFGPPGSLFEFPTKNAFSSGDSSSHITAEGREFPRAGRFAALGIHPPGTNRGTYRHPRTCHPLGHRTRRNQRRGNQLRRYRLHSQLLAVVLRRRVNASPTGPRRENSSMHLVRRRIFWFHG